MTEPRPIYPIHPGEVLAEQLEELQITAAELARELHVPANRLYQLLAGKREMTADTALRLEQWLGVSAAFWMNLQKSYELDRASAQSGQVISASGKHQRIGSISNSHAGREFESVVEAYFHHIEGLVLHPGFSIALGAGSTKKAHKFDLGADNPPILIECKSLHWTETGNIPSAKVRSCNEAMFYFLLAPSNYRMVLCMLQSAHPRRSETFAQYYARTCVHLIPPGVEIIEFDVQGGSARIIKGIDRVLPT